MILFLKKNVYAIKFIIHCFTKYKINRYNNIFFVLKVYFIRVFLSYEFIRKKLFKINLISFEETKLFEEKINSKQYFLKLKLMEYRKV